MVLKRGATEGVRGEVGGWKLGRIQKKEEKVGKPRQLNLGKVGVCGRCGCGWLEKEGVLGNPLVTS